MTTYDLLIRRAVRATLVALEPLRNIEKTQIWAGGTDDMLLALVEEMDEPDKKLIRRLQRLQKADTIYRPRSRKPLFPLQDKAPKRRKKCVVKS